MPHVLGIDPGLDGALAFYDVEAHRLLVHDMPCLKLKPTKAKKAPRCLDLPTLNQIIAAHAHRLTCAILECVSAAPGQGATSMFHFGEGYGMLQGLLQAHRVKTHLVRPGVWKSAMALGSDKNLSITRAREAFPHSGYFTLKKHDGRAEATLLALYGARPSDVSELY